jgi:hypothetical protein
MPSSTLIYKGDCSLPLCGRLEGPLGLLLDNRGPGMSPDLPCLVVPTLVPQTLFVHRGVLTKLESITGRIKTRTRPSIMGQLGRQFLTERIWAKGD